MVVLNRITRKTSQLNYRVLQKDKNTFSRTKLHYLYDFLSSFTRFSFPYYRKTGYDSNSFEQNLLILGAGY